MPDQPLVCSDCGRDFLFMESEQKLFADRGFQHPPKRCFPCRKVRKARSAAKQGHATPLHWFDVELR